MTDRSESASAPLLRQAVTRRFQDFVLLACLATSVLLLLWMFGTLGLIEAVTGAGFFAAASAAYYVGTAQVRPDPQSEGPQIEPARTAAQRVLQAVPMPAFEVDTDQRIIATNSLAQGVIGRDTSASPLASTVIRAPALLEAIDKAAREGADPALQVELEGDEGEVWRAHLTRPATSRRTLILLEDVTYSRRIAKARADFLANASHELRTPLTTISGLIETLQGPARGDPAAQDRFLALMAKESNRMNRLVADLLSLSRIETAERTPPSDRVDVSALVRECGALLEPTARAAGVSLDIEGPQGALTAIASRDELFQVVENLLSNAIKYSPRGGQVRLIFGAASSFPEARMRASQLWDPADRLMLLAPPARQNPQTEAIWLRVEDVGPGIEASHLPRLGERFYRADQSRGGEIKGTGLGLAIIKHIVTHHRGGIGVETRAGRGSAFGVWFPKSV